MSESWAGPWETRNAKTNHPKSGEGYKNEIYKAFMNQISTLSLWKPTVLEMQIVNQIV